MTLSHWLRYIQSIHVTAIDLGLDRLRPIAEKWQLTHFSCPVITVAGTNGKGSTVRALEKIYQQAGYRVAAYTSPHMIDFCERLRVNDVQISESIWCEAFEKVEAARGEITLSFFEFTLIASLLICKATPLDVLLLEIGLGGRLDAVNIVENDVAIVTSVGFDHMEWLGDTREKIAAEKAAIVRKQLICGEADCPETVETICREKAATLFQIHRDFDYCDEGSTWSFNGKKTDYRKLSKPALLLSNVSCALMAVELLVERLPVTEAAISTAMSGMSLTGRYEVFSESPRVILDVAHNPQAAAILKTRLASVSGKVRAVFSALGDKQIEAMVALLKDTFSSWYIAGLPSEQRGLSGASILAKIATLEIKNCYTFETVSQALESAIRDSAPEETVVVWGSFHTVGQAKQFLRKKSHENAI